MQFRNIQSIFPAVLIFQFALPFAGADENATVFGLTRITIGEDSFAENETPKLPAENADQAKKNAALLRRVAKRFDALAKKALSKDEAARMRKAANLYSRTAVAQLEKFGDVEPEPPYGRSHDSRNPSSEEEESQVGHSGESE